MRFNGICMISDNVGRLRDFYKEVLQVEAEGENVFVTFSMEGTMLSIFSAEGMERMAPGSLKDAGCGRYTSEFEVEDVDQEYERLTGMNVPIVKPPTTQPWGRRSFWFRDPDGNILTSPTDKSVGFLGSPPRFSASSELPDTPNIGEQVLYPLHRPDFPPAQR